MESSRIELPFRNRTASWDPPFPLSQKSSSSARIDPRSAAAGTNRGREERGPLRRRKQRRRRGGFSRRRRRAPIRAAAIGSGGDEDDDNDDDDIVERRRGGDDADLLRGIRGGRSDIRTFTFIIIRKYDWSISQKSSQLQIRSKLF